MRVEPIESREKAEPLSKFGAVICDSPGEAAERADVVLTMLAEAAAVTSVAADAFPPDHPVDIPIWPQMSTIGEQGTDSCQDLARERAIRFVDTPVLGSKELAQERKLVMLASGPEELQPRLTPLFEAIGQRTMWLGEAGSGSRLKLAINAWIGAVVEGGAEVLSLAEVLGCDRHDVLKALSGGLLDLPYLQMKGKKMLEGPSFTLELAVKDMRSGLRGRRAP
jgi:3-hydroxyisobutyrate dehydrogenase